MTPGDKVAGLFEKSHLGMQDATRNSETVKSAVSAAFGSLHYIYIHYCMYVNVIGSLSLPSVIYLSVLKNTSPTGSGPTGS